MGDLGLDERVILKWIPKKFGNRMRTGLNRLGIVSSDGLL